MSPLSLKSHSSCSAVFLKERTFSSPFVGQLQQEEMFSLTGNQLFPTSHSVLLLRIHLFCFSFQHLSTGSGRWPWIRKGLRRGWGLLLCKLHTGGASRDCCGGRVCGRMYLSANGVSLTDCTSVFSGIFHTDHSLELDGKIVEYFKTAGPWEMRVPQHELLKLGETVQKSQHEPAHGEGGVCW